jgi:hypothetical protein
MHGRHERQVPIARDGTDTVNQRIESWRKDSPAIAE